MIFFTLTFSILKPLEMGVEERVWWTQEEELSAQVLGLVVLFFPDLFLSFFAHIWAPVSDFV